MSEHERAITRLRERIRLVLWAKYAILFCAAWGFLWGTVVLAGRVGMQWDRLLLAWGAVGLVPVLLGAWWLATRKTPSPAAVRALVDERSDAGGLLMAAEEADTGPWAGRLPLVAAPSLHWRGGRAWLMLLVAVAFVATTFALPQQLGAVSEQQRLNVESQAAELHAQIETLKEENILDAETAEQMQREVDDVAQDASARDPMKTFEALDHLARGLKREAEQASEKAVADAERAAGVQATAEAIEQAAAEMDPQSLKESLSEMAELTRRAREEGALANLDEQTLAKLRELAERDPEALAKMAEQAKAQQELEKLTDQMAALGEHALARVDDAGEVTLFEPDEAMTAATLAKSMPNDDYAVRGGGEPAVFKSGFGERVKLDAQVKQAVFGEGEKVVAMAGEKRLGVYQPTGEGERRELDQLAEDQVATVNVAGEVALYARDAEATQRAQDAANGAGNEAGRAMRRLAEAAAGQRMDLKQMIRALADARMVDPEQIQRMEEAGRIDREALARLLKEAKEQNMDGRTLCQLAGQCVGPGRQMGDGAKQGTQPGRFGVNRGRGDAPMTWQDPSSEENAAFKEQVLPPNQLDPERSERIGVSVGAPEEEAGEASTGGQLRGAEADGGSVNRQRVLPQHREAVEGYFQTREPGE